MNLQQFSTHVLVAELGFDGLEVIELDEVAAKENRPASVTPHPASGSSMGHIVMK